jgi:glutamate N-acetyltransferase/amino-acid N-acetyltransferase
MKKTDHTKLIIPIKGGVTAAAGFYANGIAAGIKKSKNADLGIIASEAPCCAAGAFTTNAIRAACVTWNEALLPSEGIHAVVCNSGNANACTGKQGEKDIATITSQVRKLLGNPADSTLVASTGVIGEFLPMPKITAAIPKCIAELDVDGGDRFARAIMTTDTVKKEYAVKLSLPVGDVTIGGCVKGAGMINPKMATMLGFITTDALIAPVALQRIVRRVVDWTFNNLTIDGDTSTNDMVLVLANGVSAVAIRSKSDLELFQNALFDVCNNLCAQIAADGEGATKRIEINVTGGTTYLDCKRAAKAIANSNLVKTAMFGNDPNWGRILCAIGYSGAKFSQKHLSVSLCGQTVYRDMRPATFDAKAIHADLHKKIVIIDVDLGQGGKTCAVAHTCDFSYDYVKINADYHT